MVSWVRVLYRPRACAHPRACAPPRAHAPSRTLARAPTRSRAHAPSRTRARAPTRSRDRETSRHRARAPTHPRARAPSRHLIPTRPRVLGRSRQPASSRLTLPITFGGRVPHLFPKKLFCSLLSWSRQRCPLTRPVGRTRCRWRVRRGRRSRRRTPTRLLATRRRPWK